MTRRQKPAHDTTPIMSHEEELLLTDVSGQSEQIIHHVGNFVLADARRLIRKVVSA